MICHRRWGGGPDGRPRWADWCVGSVQTSSSASLQSEVVRPWLASVSPPDRSRTDQAAGSRAGRSRRERTLHGSSEALFVESSGPDHGNRSSWLPLHSLPFLRPQAPWLSRALRATRRLYLPPCTTCRCKPLSTGVIWAGVRTAMITSRAEPHLHPPAICVSQNPQITQSRRLCRPPGQHPVLYLDRPPPRSPITATAASRKRRGQRRRGTARVVRASSRSW